MEVHLLQLLASRALTKVGYTQSISLTPFLISINVIAGSDPGITTNIYSGLKTYTIPGMTNVNTYT